MPDLTCTARRLGDFESRTEEYEVSFSVEDGETKIMRIKYQAARAYEINAALDSLAEAAREAITSSESKVAARLSEESLSQLAWRTMQSAKYEEGEPRSSVLEL